MLWLALLLAASMTVLASPAPGPWIPMFKGIDHAIGTNTPGLPGSFPRLQVAHCIRVDLSDPDVQLLTTPRATNYVAEFRETLTRMVPNFLKLNKLQIAADAGFYSANPGGADPAGEGVACEVFGLQISAGTMVSPAANEAKPRYASLLFTTNKQPAFLFNNRPPGTNTAGIYTAITGFYPIVSNGVNVGAESINAYPDAGIHEIQPRTAYGVSGNNRYFYIMTIDGRQPGYSEGALDVEAAYWMMQFGAWNAINMDGGGSTALYAADSIGNPVSLNRSSYLAAYGRERYVGSHLGVYAKPLPGSLNEVLAVPDDTTAAITWTTISPGTTQVRYGLTTELNLESSFDAALVTNHTVLLTNLTPNTGYYFAASSQIDGAVSVSSTFFFTTANYVTTNALFGLTNVWKYMTTNLDGVNWTAPGYDDLRWNGSGPGLLWADTRGFPAADIPVPMMTSLPVPGGTAPYPTYYFRTHFNFTNDLSGIVLMFESYVDDGAVYYLNGAEVYRLRMSAAPAVINNTSLALGFSGTGNATVPDEFSVSGPPIAANLVTGDNVLAVEVHNYKALSPDITFGSALSYTAPYNPKTSLGVAYSNGTITLSWSGTGFTLQRASSSAGPWLDVPGPVVTSPYTTPNSGSTRFFRLRK